MVVGHRSAESLGAFAVACAACCIMAVVRAIKIVHGCSQGGSHVVMHLPGGVEARQVVP